MLGLSLTLEAFRLNLSPRLKEPLCWEAPDTRGYRKADDPRHPREAGGLLFGIKGLLSGHGPKSPRNARNAPARSAHPRKRLPSALFLKPCK